jgi:dihydrofolate reductase
MGNVVIDMSMSLHGYIATSNDNPQQGLGEDGMRLHTPDVRRSVGVRARVRRLTQNNSAVIMGRRTYDNSVEDWGGKGPLGEFPCFVVTHRLIEGADPTFTLVTGGIESALAKAQEAAARSGSG